MPRPSAAPLSGRPTMAYSSRSISSIPSGNRVEVTHWTAKPGQLDKLKEIAPVMLEEWDRTKKVPRQAAWVHEKEFV